MVIFSRALRYTIVETMRNKYSPNKVVFLDAGDEFQGTLWFYQYKGAAAAYFMNKLKYDVMAIGNHEFDNGPQGLANFLRNVTFPVLSCNIDPSKEPVLYEDLPPPKRFRNYTIISRDQKRIAVIGYTTTETPLISRTGKTIFLNEITSLRKQIEVIKSNEGKIDLMIALGHAGYHVDKEIARQVKGLDIVVGGHTNTFLYTGTQPSTEEPVADYPTIIEQDDGKKVLVVQDYAFGKYMGFLKLSISDTSNQILSWSGSNPILLGAKVLQDPEVLKEMEQWKIPLAEAIKTTVGQTIVFLNGVRSHCRLKECNLANFMADAMIDFNLGVESAETAGWDGTGGTGWASSAIAIVNGGSIRTSIKEGSITMADVLAVLPFHNTVDMIDLTGSGIMTLLEIAVSEHDPVIQHGRFLQFSGLRVKYDLSRPVGSRVVGVRVRCAACSYPSYSALNRSEVYRVTMPSFLIDDGDGYNTSKVLLKRYPMDSLDTDIFTDFVKKRSPVYIGVDDRIQFVTLSDQVGSGGVGCGQQSGKVCDTSGGDAIIKSISLYLILSFYAFIYGLLCLTFGGQKSHDQLLDRSSLYFLHCYYESTYSSPNDLFSTIKDLNGSRSNDNGAIRQVVSLGK